MNNIEERIEQKLFYAKLKYHENVYKNLKEFYRDRVFLHKITNCLVFLEDFKGDVFHRSLYNQYEGNIFNVLTNLYNNNIFHNPNFNSLNSIINFGKNVTLMDFVPQKTSYEDVFSKTYEHEYNLDFLRIENSQDNDLITLTNFCNNNFIFFDNFEDCKNSINKILEYYIKK